MVVRKNYSRGGTKSFADKRRAYNNRSARMGEQLIPLTNAVLGRKEWGEADLQEVQQSYTFEDRVVTASCVLHDTRRDAAAFYLRLAQSS